MKVTDIRKMKTEDLTAEATKLREDIVDTRRRIHMGEMQNVRSLRTKKKDLARMLTVLGEQLAKETK